MTESEIRLLAQAAGLEIDPAYLPEVARNFDILLDQAALLFECPIDPLIEPAPAFRP